jgi:PAS domain S-box-containing protein
MNSNGPGQPDVDGSKTLPSAVTDLNPGHRGAEMALAESERRYRDLVETSYDLIWAVDETGRITYLNQACRKIYGREPEEMIGRMFLEFVPPEQYEKDVAAFSEAIRTGKQTVDYTSRIYHADGSIVILLANAVIMRDENGQVIGSTGMARDMTKSMLAEESLRASEARLARAQAIAHLGSWELDLTKREGLNRLSWSDEIYRIFGIAPSAFGATYEAFLAAVHPEDRKRMEEAQRRALAGEAGLNIEHRILRSDGTVRWVQEQGALERDAEGRPTRLNGTVLDITERKLAEQTLRKSETLLRIAGKAARLGGWTLELPEYKLTWSDETSVLHDLPPGYQPTFEEGISMFPPESRAEVARCVEACAREGKSYDFEVPKITATGRRIWVRSIGEAVRDGDGKIVRLQGAFQDITERKKLESNLLRAQRLESIGTLAGGIAHDLNNVLAPILMSVTLLKAKMADAESERLLHTLQKSAQRGADLVKQVLSFARGVEGQRIEVNPAQLLREIRTVVRETFPKSIVVELTAKRNSWSVMGDPTQLHQVFLNLCVNARDAMPDGGGLTIKLENVMLDEAAISDNSDAKPGTYVAVQVADTGCGITPEVRDRIFEPFFTTKALGKGTGLGLSTTLAIVKSHGGFINFTSETGKGTTFLVYLPAETTKTATGEATLESTPLPRGNGELILVVDDEESIRQIARPMLENYGYRVLLASQGEEAVALYARQRHEIAVVITDMAMPIMDGPALITALRSLNPQVRIIGSSGHTSPGGTTQLAGMGIEHFVPKPYPAEVLLKTLHDVLNGTATG